MLRRLTHLSISAKLFSGFMLMVLVVVGLGVFSSLKLKEVNNFAMSIEKEYLPSTFYAGQIVVDIQNYRLAELQHILSKSESEKESWEKDMESRQKDLESHRAAYTTLMSSAEEIKLLQDIDQEWGDYLGEHVKILSLSRQDRDQDALVEIHGESQKTFEKLTQTLALVNKANLDNSKEAGIKGEEVFDVARGGIMISVLFAAALGFFIGWAIHKTIKSPVDRATLGLTDAAEEVATAARQIAAMSEQISSGAIEQASALQETSASVHELSAMIAETASNANLAADASQSSLNKANLGRDAVKRMIESVDEVSRNNDEVLKQIAESNKDVLQITGLIQEIGEKTKVINEIVFQTKLLSFNASVEAARAGEHGRGFAVVAEEVGHLARMSGDAAKEISSLLENSVSRVNEIVEKTSKRVTGLSELSRKKVKESSQVAHDCGDALRDIVENTEEASQRTTEIRTAAREQSHGIEGITQATQQLDQVTQEAAASSQHSSQAARHLYEQAARMRSMVEAMTEAIYGMKSRDESSSLTDLVSSTSDTKDDKPQNKPASKSKAA